MTVTSDQRTANGAADRRPVFPAPSGRSAILPLLLLLLLLLLLPLLNLSAAADRKIAGLKPRADLAIHY